MVRFELTVPFDTTVFKTVALNRSATLPRKIIHYLKGFSSDLRSLGALTLSPPGKGRFPFRSEIGPSAVSVEWHEALRVTRGYGKKGEVPVGRRGTVLCYTRPMKYLGIDYGSKRIGVAISDESGEFAFPKEIVASGAKALGEIVNLVVNENVGKIVVGNSLDQSGERNFIMEDIDAFVEELYKLTGVPVALADERFSSSAVKAFDWRKPIADKRGSPKSQDPIDDRAAAIMLQRYLDKQD